MAIQIEKTKISTGLEGQTILLYGRPKAGKTTLVNEFEAPLFLATEAGHRHIKCEKFNLHKWSDFLEACAFVGEGKHEYKTIVIDTIDNLVDMCSEVVCKDLGITSPGDLDGGKGYIEITKELKRVVKKLTDLDYTIVFISHCVREQIKTSKGKKYDRWTIPIGGKNKGVFLGISDLILFIDYDIDPNTSEETRTIRTRQSASYDAGDRSNKLAPSIPFTSPKQGYEELKKQMEA